LSLRHSLTFTRIAIPPISTERTTTSHKKNNLPPTKRTTTSHRKNNYLPQKEQLPPQKEQLPPTKRTTTSHKKTTTYIDGSAILV
jgi:hypothetical protein